MVDSPPRNDKGIKKVSMINHYRKPSGSNGSSKPPGGSKVDQSVDMVKK
jgi:hypothetical protein